MGSWAEFHRCSIPDGPASERVAGRADGLYFFYGRAILFCNATTDDAAPWPDRVQSWMYRRNDEVNWENSTAGYKGMSIRATVTTILEQVAREQQRTLVPLSDDLKLSESGLDSLSFAIAVVKLEDELGFDPFSSDEPVEFPIKFSDFVHLYEARPR